MLPSISCCVPVVGGSGREAGGRDRKKVLEGREAGAGNQGPRKSVGTQCGLTAPASLTRVCSPSGGDTRRGWRTREGFGRTRGGLGCGLCLRRSGPISRWGPIHRGPTGPDALGPIPSLGVPDRAGLRHPRVCEGTHSRRGFPNHHERPCRPHTLGRSERSSCEGRLLLLAVGPAQETREDTDRHSQQIYRKVIACGFVLTGECSFLAVAWAQNNYKRRKHVLE